MSKNYKTLLLVSLLSLFQFSYGQDLVHYWNFNDNSSLSNLIAPTQSAVPGASINAIQGGASLIDFAGGTGQNFNVLNLNARNGDASGTHLRFNFPIGGGLEFALPTTGYENVIVTFATRRSGSGAGDQLWSYSIDGTNFVSFTTVVPNNGDPGLATLDFTSITGADDNPLFKIRVTFEQGGGGVEGNNRFDNFTVDAENTGGDILAPVAMIMPANLSASVAIDINPTITFNEEVRLVNNDALTSTNVDALVELRLNSASGALVPFDATYAGSTISIIPSTALANNQTYYVALLGNSVEDLSNNALAAVSSSIFTTVAVQTTLATGDLVFTAYRMSATGADDAIALVTFANIFEGTIINFTDAKYTTNAQPQCAGGIVWTASQCIPAGSIITIQTAALISNNGTVTGTGFGLSSAGDQVIVYTGTATAPNYITALTSNGWVSTNTECGGSLSILPATLADGTSAMNGSTIVENVAGNTANAYYNGIEAGTTAELKAAIQNPANWVGSIANSAPQTWPAWNFPASLQVLSVVPVDLNTIQVTFNNNVDLTSGTNTANYTGIDGLGSVAISGNVATLTYSTALTPNTDYSLVISNVADANAAMPCVFTYNFNSSLSTPEFYYEAFALYPNPSHRAIVYFSRSADVNVFDVTGKMVYTAKNISSINTASFATGLYVLKAADGITKKLIVN